MTIWAARSSPSGNPDARIEEDTFYVPWRRRFIRAHMGGGSCYQAWD